MSETNLACPSCSQVFAVSAELLGQEVACPHCSQVVAAVAPSAKTATPQQPIRAKNMAFNVKTKARKYSDIKIKTNNPLPNPNAELWGEVGRQLCLDGYKIVDRGGIGLTVKLLGGGNWFGCRVDASGTGATPRLCAKFGRWGRVASMVATILGLGYCFVHDFHSIEIAAVAKTGATVALLYNVWRWVITQQAMNKIKHIYANAVMKQSC